MVQKLIPHFPSMRWKMTFKMQVVSAIISFICETKQNKTKQNKHYQIFQKPQNIPRFTLLAWDFYFAFSRAVRAALFFFQIKHLARHLHTSPLSQGWGVKCNLTHMGLATRYLYRRSIKICATMPSQLPHNHSNTHTHHRTTTDYRPLLQ